MKLHRLALLSALHLNTAAVGAVRIAFVGDSGIEGPAINNFKQMRDENIDVVIHNGDFDYESRPNDWKTFLQSHWQGDRQFLATSGNHETDKDSTDYTENGVQWPQYKQVLHSRYAGINQEVDGRRVECTGIDGAPIQADAFGEYMSCRVGNVAVVFVGWNEMNHQALEGGAAQQHKAKALSFIETSLATKSEGIRWKVCVWHRPEGELNPGISHTGNYDTQEMYDVCRRQGAIVVSGHSHVYGRSMLLNQMSPSYTTSSNDEKGVVKLSCGETVSFVAGAGGRFIDKVRQPQRQHLRTWFTKESNEYADNASLMCDFKHTEANCWLLVAANKDNFKPYVPEQFQMIPVAEDCTTTSAPTSTVTSAPTSTVTSAPTTPSPTFAPTQALEAQPTFGCKRAYIPEVLLKSGTLSAEWCGDSCCASSSSQRCYYSVPDPTVCGAPSDLDGSSLVHILPIEDGADDVEETNVGSGLSLNSVDLEIVQDFENKEDPSDATQTIGLRFRGAMLERARKIRRAYILFRVKESDNGEMSGIRISGEKAGNSAPWAVDAKPSQRAPTVAEVAWDSVDAWVAASGIVSTEQTVPITQVVQEIVDQPDWAPGNALSLIIKGGQGKRVAESFETRLNGVGAPRLVVVYEETKDPKPLISPSMSGTVAGVVGGLCVLSIVMGGVAYMSWKKDQVVGEDVFEKKRISAFSSTSSMLPKWMSLSVRSRGSKGSSGDRPQTPKTPMTSRSPVMTLSNSNLSAAEQFKTILDTQKPSSIYLEKDNIFYIYDSKEDEEQTRKISV